MKISIRIDGELHNGARAEAEAGAKENGLTFEEYLRRLWADFIAGEGIEGRVKVEIL